MKYRGQCRHPYSVTAVVSLGGAPFDPAGMTGVTSSDTIDAPVHQIRRRPGAAPTSRLCQLDGFYETRQVGRIGSQQLTTQTAAAGAVARRPAQYNTDPVSRPGLPSPLRALIHQRPYLPSVPFLSRAPPSPKGRSHTHTTTAGCVSEHRCTHRSLSTNPSACLPAGHFALLARCRSLDTARLRAGGGASSSTRLFDVRPLRPQSSA